MQDHELYRRILGIEAPWLVDAVELKLTGEIDVHLRHRDMIHWPCPEGGVACRLYDHQPERQWRHLDTCQYQTILHAEPPRSEMPGARRESHLVALGGAVEPVHCTA